MNRSRPYLAKAVFSVPWPFCTSRLYAMTFKVHNTLYTGNIEVLFFSKDSKCVVGGILACGLTHTAICPLDVTKCNMQVCYLLKKNNFSEE